MATLNQFQQYSQGENTITNNILLMFSSLYELNPKYYEEYINGLIEENEYYQVIPSFEQQFSNKGDGFIDGHIRMPASRIIIETKIAGLEWIEKLLKYTKSFSGDEVKLLFHLSIEKYQEAQVEEITKRLEENDLTKSVKFFSITYKDLSLQLESIRSLYPYDQYLQRLCTHFNEYTFSMGLRPDPRHILRAMACGQSYDLNIKHQFYFDQKERSYRRFDYFGIYFHKAVRYLAEIENMLLADYFHDEGLRVYESTYPPTGEQIVRLKMAIEESINSGWNIEQNHRFFLFKNFEETYFEKISPGGIMRTRYFYLEDEPGIKPPGNMKDLAELLRQHTWE